MIPSSSQSALTFVSRFPCSPWRAGAWRPSSSACARRRVRARAHDPGALGDEFALELGERGEDAEDEFAGGRRRVDRRALAGENAQSDSAGRSFMVGFLARGSI